MSTIYWTTQTLFDLKNIRSKNDLDIWCGAEGRKKLYTFVKAFAPDHWGKLKKPESATRSYYERVLRGYKFYKP